MNTPLRRERTGLWVRASIGILILLFSTAAVSQLLDFFRSWADVEIDQVLTDVRNARNNTTGLPAGTAGVRDLVDVAKSNLDVLSDNLHEALALARAEGNERLREEIAGAQAFAGANECRSPSACFEFRENVMQLLGDFEEIGNALLLIHGDASGPGLRLQFERERGLIERAPAMALYPIYRASTFGGDLFATGLLDTTGQARASLATAVQALGEADSCDFTNGNPGRVRRDSFQLITVAIRLKLVGKALSAAGETLVLGGPKELGVHGYFLLNFHNNRQKKLGEVFNALAGYTERASVAMNNKLLYCTALAQHTAARAALDANMHPANRHRKN